MSSCVRMFVPRDCCYVKFQRKVESRLGKRTKYEYSKDVGYTVRGEQVIIDYDRTGSILGIELLGSQVAKKRCM